MARTLTRRRNSYLKRHLYFGASLLTSLLAICYMVRVVNEWQPDLSRVTFIKEETGGYSKKYRVKDGRGRVWVAKIGKEAQSETAAVRLVWAVGYVSEINYLVPRVTIEGKRDF